MSRAAWTAFPVLALLTACATIPAGADWTRYDVAAVGRLLAAASPSEPRRGDILTVFIEGDGAAHDARGRPSRDPTPRDPVSLEIAKAWPGDGPTAWLGRLCQYVRQRDPACKPSDWTLDRFSPPAVAAANVAIDTLKQRAGASQVILIGWSGGGTLATLAAARRSDVEALVTISAPLDLTAWTTALNISPLPADGDPARIVWTTPPVRQLHLYGGRDTTVPARTQRAAAEKLGGTTLVWPRETHACCWARRAAEIEALAKPPAP